MAREIMPGVTELTREEGRAMFDRRCREALGIPGEQFLAAWDAGELSPLVIRDAAHLGRIAGVPYPGPELR